MQLCISRCRAIKPFLAGLATAFSKSTESLPALKDVEVVLRKDEPDAEESVEAIEKLLQSLLGLQALWLDTSWFRVIDKECFNRHRATLVHIGVNTGEEQVVQHYCAADIHSIVTSCTELRTLALNLPPVDLGYINYLGQDFSLREPVSADTKSELETVLVGGYLVGTGKDDAD